MSLLSTVTEALGYENLGGGYKQPTSQITSIPSRDGSGVRQPLNLPTGIVPGVQNPIPTSTARPGKQTNQRIVYTRVQTQFHKDGCGHVASVPTMEGDVVFVHRQDGTNSPGVNSGADTARTSRIASVTQLNEMLKSGNVNTNGELTMAARINLESDPAAPDRWRYLDPRGEDPSPDSENPTWERWVNCKALARWTPDGVLAGNEHDCVMDNSNPGEAFNVAIGGPTLTRNSATGDYPQHFDDGVRVLDKLFVGLIGTEHRQYDELTDTYGGVEYFSYQYKLFTSRQLAWAPLGQQTVQVKDMERNAPGGSNGLGPTVDDYARMVSVWRIGSILDSKAGMMPYRCATVNVVVEPWDLKMIQMEFNPYFGESLSLAPVDAVTVTQVLDAARGLIGAEAVAITRGLEVLGPLFEQGFTHEVSQWKATDEAWQSNVHLADLRGKSAADYPAPTVGPQTSGHHHGSAIGSKTYYLDGSAGIKAFFVAFQNEAVWCATCRQLFGTYITLLASVGRVSSFSSDKELMKWITAQGREAIVAEALKLHTTVMALRPIIRLGEVLVAGPKASVQANGGSWPLV